MSNDEHLELPRLRDTVESERTREILMSAQQDAPSARARQAALLAVGLGAATTVAAKTAAAGVGASKGAKVVLSSLALKWIVGSAMVGAISAGTFVVVQHETTREQGGTAEPRASTRPQGHLRPAAAQNQPITAPSLPTDDMALPTAPGPAVPAALSAAPLLGIASSTSAAVSARSTPSTPSAHAAPVTSLAALAAPAPSPDTSALPSMTASGATATSIAQELAQVEHARALLRQGHPSDAMRAASAYRKTYPHGTFLPEVETIETEARKLMAP